MGAKEDLTVALKSFAWWRFWSTTLCEHCGMPRGFTPDGRKLLLWSDSSPAPHLDLLDVLSRRVQPAVVANTPLSAPRISADGRWISFVAKVGNGFQGFVAPIHDDRPALGSDWVPVTSPTPYFFYAF